MGWLVVPDTGVNPLEARNLCEVCATLWPQVADPVLSQSLAFVIVTLSLVAASTWFPKYGPQLHRVPCIAGHIFRVPTLGPVCPISLISSR